MNWICILLSPHLLYLPRDIYWSLENFAYLPTVTALSLHQNPTYFFIRFPLSLSIYFIHHYPPIWICFIVHFRYNLGDLYLCQSCPSRRGKKLRYTHLVQYWTIDFYKKVWEVGMAKAGESLGSHGKNWVELWGWKMKDSEGEKEGKYYLFHPKLV